MRLTTPSICAYRGDLRCALRQMHQPTSASQYDVCDDAQAQGHSNEDNLDRTVFVGNLRATMKPKAIKQLFARC